VLNNFQNKNKQKMKKIFFPALTVLALFTLPSFSMLPADVIDTHNESEVTETLAGCGTEITITGHETLDLHGVVNKNRIHASSHLVGRYTGIDTNGNTYIAHEDVMMNSNSPIDNGAFSNTQITTIHFVSQGSAPNFSVRVTIKITVNANGETTVLRAPIFISCD